MEHDNNEILQYPIRHHYSTDIELKTFSNLKTNQKIELKFSIMEKEQSIYKGYCHELIEIN